MSLGESFRDRSKFTICQQDEADETAAIVLIHGFGGGAFAWRLIMAELAAKSRCRVYALDRPGFGKEALPGRRVLPYVLELETQSLRCCNNVLYNSTLDRSKQTFRDISVHLLSCPAYKDLLASHDTLTNVSHLHIPTSRVFT